LRCEPTTCLSRREEIFGRSCPFGFDTEEEGHGPRQATEFGLAATVCSKDLSRAHRVAAGLKQDLYINTYNDAPVEARFGGMKNSGVA